MKYLKTPRLINSILITLLSIYPLLTIFIIEGEVHTIPAIVVAQLTFWLLVLLIISSYFLTKINIYFVTLLSILNITLNLILSFVFLKLNLTDLANPNQVYIYLPLVLVFYMFGVSLFTLKFGYQLFLPYFQ